MGKTITHSILRKKHSMSQYHSADHYTFVNDSGSVQIKYDPSVSAPSTGNQRSEGPRFEYHGLEGDLVFPRYSAGPTQVSVQEDSPLGPLVSVMLIPTIDAISVTLTLLLPPINMTGIDQLDFQTVAIKSTSYGLLPRTGARLGYEVISLRGTAHSVQDLSQNIHENSST
jgi:hypothetical protein